MLKWPTNARSIRYSRIARTGLLHLGPYALPLIVDDSIEAQPQIGDQKFVIVQLEQYIHGERAVVDG